MLRRNKTAQLVTHVIAILMILRDVINVVVN